jgi:hypothetical protein
MDYLSSYLYVPFQVVMKTYENPRSKYSPIFEHGTLPDTKAC